MKKFMLLTGLLLTLFTQSLFAAPIDNTSTLPPQGNTTDYAQVVNKMTNLGDDLIKNYDPKNGLETMDGFSGLYFDHYEGSGMELAVMAVSPSVNTKTEALFTRLIGKSSEGAEATELQHTWSELKIRLHDDLDLLQSNTANSFSEAFLQSFIILVREGFEALLVITALLAYLRRAGHSDKTHVITYGVIAALVASGFTAYGFATIFKTQGANREAMEGITMLVAAFVLFYVSYWLFSKREAQRWQSYIQQKVSHALTSGSLFALGLAAFLAVYREGAETILFYQALSLGAKGQGPALILGFVAACFALGFIYWAMKTASFKIPYKFFFTATAIFLYYMAFFFIGGGILELQEAGWVSISPIDWLPELGWLGIYPTVESFAAQMLFLIPSVSGLVWYARRQSKVTQLQATEGAGNV